MQASKPGKSLLKYLPLLAVTVAAIAGALIVEDANYPLLDFGIKATTQLQAEQTNALPAEQDPPQVMVFPETAGTCLSGLVFTSLPPKCKTLSGDFIQLPGSSNVFVIPPK
jgi:hypothetical protein